MASCGRVAEACIRLCGARASLSEVVSEKYARRRSPPPSCGATSAGRRKPSGFFVRETLIILAYRLHPPVDRPARCLARLHLCIASVHDEYTSRRQSSAWANSHSTVFRALGGPGTHSRRENLRCDFKAHSRQRSVWTAPRSSIAAVQNLMEPDNKDKLRKILTCHVVPGRLDSERSTRRSRPAVARPRAKPWKAIGWS